ncbi:MAG TPA: isoleucine--tRNA ligase [Bacillota bacterium]|jgi:isoleucyl-tRNA synthetase|nr:isoleucine--tRNA ligase [Bacillota bacterium]HOL10276.1 isoleucine--tRNA ligase [Bacillota bacterium]HPO97394.1 isoleucine--tRNA ligase [Bacillota bacterium]
MDYNKTLNLPQTDFPMKANLPQREPEIQQKWEANKLYHRVQEQAKQAGRPKFILHDGPPYANGHIHIGTALNKILKDIVVKFKTMEGYYVPYVPGWDTHGLPIEQQVIKETKLNRNELSVVDFRKRCEEYALKFFEIQRDEFKKLGVGGYWEDPYLTLAPKYEAKQIEIFGEMAQKGYIYKGLKPVYWCSTCETALAEAEIDYADKTSFSIYVKFAVVDGKGVLPTEDTFVVIWTTTPWTLPANLAISVNPDFVYNLIQVGNEKYLIARELVERFAQETGIDDYQIVAEIEGDKLEGIKTQHPFMGWESPLLLGDHVTLEQGTGCVHTAPGHGAEDYQIGLKYGLPAFAPVTPQGRFSPEAGKYAGIKLNEGNQIIIDDLKASGHLVGSGEIVHQYPHCWRCKHPVIFRATEQWFASVEGFRKEALEAIKNVQWIPAWGEGRIHNMVADRSDWCISRQRTWGVPIPILYCEDCGKELINKEIIAKVAAIFAEEGSSAWWVRDAADFLPEDTVCPECGGSKFRKETDIMDVWFDSGSSHAAVLEVWPELEWPADLYLEGSDQHRGWFQSSLLTGVAARGRAPFKAVLTHGYVVDADGRKMSKSLGNVIAPEMVIKEFGVDILRLWVASSDYQADIRISKDILKQLAEVYRRIRNTCRFLLGNLNDFNPDTDAVPYENLTELDRWALLRLEKLVRKVIDAYQKYEFHIQHHAIHNFCTIDLSSLYLDIIKDRLYTSATNDPGRRAAQTVLYQILVKLTKLIAPVLSHTAEEIWTYLPYKKETSVHETLMPEFNDQYLNPELEKTWDEFLTVRQDVSKALELARAQKVIGSSLEAKVILYIPAGLEKLMQHFAADLPTLFIVSQVEVQNEANAPETAYSSESVPGLRAQVEKASGAKCERCWNYHTSVSQDAEHPTLCHRCASVVKSL